MKFVSAVLTLCLFIAPTTALAGPPDVEAIRKSAYEAAGGLEAFQQLGVLQLAITQEETLANGEQRKNQTTAYVDARTLSDLRLEISGDIVVGRNGETSWATRDGKIDDRPQTPTRLSINGSSRCCCRSPWPWTASGSRTRKRPTSKVSPRGGSRSTSRRAFSSRPA